ncbi:hypothetical protein E3N88_34559 [Mikania micrantha]|uniref:Uncharacterized protein n=1 Tax=Mikania micrantha TaxID=192012 RepID=A0A5N6LYG9_9ASTR|nr:hypothetical protein E3N88_34559 [Mikania micrantha]
MLPESRNEDKTKIWPPYIRASRPRSSRKYGFEVPAAVGQNLSTASPVKEQACRLRVVSVIESCERTGLSTVGRQCHRDLCCTSRLTRVSRAALGKRQEEKAASGTRERPSGAAVVRKTHTAGKDSSSRQPE